MKIKPQPASEGVMDIEKIIEIGIKFKGGKVDSKFLATAIRKGIIEEISRTKLSRIVGKYIYLRNGEWILHDEGCDKIALEIYDQITQIIRGK